MRGPHMSVRHLLFAAAVALLAVGAARADIVIGTAGPLQGQYAALGEQLRRGAQMAVDDINAGGGIAGEKLRLEVGDDSCDPRKAVDVATAFVAKGVKFVAGHYCSGASIPAARIYETAGIVLISPSSTLPKLTDEGGWNVLRTCPRDDAQGTIAGAYIAGKYPLGKIAILADQAPADKALAQRVKEALNARGVTETLFENYVAGGKDYSALAQKLVDAAIGVVYVAGAYPEAALVLREIHDLGRNVQMISDDALVTDEFWNAAGDVGEGTLMTFPPDPLKIEAAQAVIQRFRDAGFVPEGYTLNAYAAVQAWVQAAEATAGTDPRKIAAWLRAGNKVSTVLGEISFDAKGDVNDPRYAWFRWSQGKYVEVPAP
jgi:branched-chain amino acid transport system substrate-binding protein